MMTQTTDTQPAEKRSEKQTSPKRFLELLHGDGSVFEIRIPRAPNQKGSNFRRTASGYFNNLDAAEKQIAHYETVEPAGIYCTMNPVRPDLIARSANRIQFDAKNTTSDKDIESRRWMLIDIDPTGKRPSGTSSTNDEMLSAITKSREIRQWLADRGWPDAVRAMSGNGSYLLFRIELPNDDATTDLIQDFLEAIASRFDSADVEIDRKVYNASRILKVGGTWARKGDHLTGVDGIADRPHRQSCFVVDEPILPVERALIESVVREHLEAHPKAPKMTSKPSAAADSENVKRCRSYIAKMQPAVQGQDGSAKTLEAGAMTARFGLSADDAWPLMEEFNQRCQPPWDERELQRKLDEGHRKVAEDGSFGSMLERDSTPTTSRNSGTIDEGLEDLLPFENPTDPARLARLNVSRYEERFNAKLVYWQAQWWRWRNGRWTHLSSDEIDAKVRIGIDQELTLIAESEEAAGQKNPQKKSISTAMVRNVIDAMKSRCFLKGRVEMPQWLDDDTKHTKFVAVANGLLDIDALLSGFQPDDCLIPHSSNWFAAVNLEFDFEPGATAERWLQYIESSLPEPKAQLLAQEWAGYLLLSGNPFQKFMTCEGEGGTGKSVYVAGCTAMLNPLSVSHAELREFGSRFGLSDTIGKAMNVDSDVQQDAKFSEGGFKKFCIGERMAFEFKGGATFSHRPTAKVMMCWNERPRIKDTSNGFWRRMLLLSFERVVPKSEIIRGLDQPEWWIESGELPGILNWALEGLQRLASQGGFTEPESMQKLIREYRRDQNPVQGFLDEMVRQWEPTSIWPKEHFEFQSTRGLVAAFRDWCEDNASPADAEAMTPRKMGWAVRKKFPEIESTEANTVTEGHVRGYRGIKILTSKELQEEKNSLPEGKLF
jgi:P4 family phage/plasmid primase-like protien